jgi:LmbE family N-acetylglucosaminyl deacetylase
MTRLLIVSSNPDDETLGAGGTLLRHKALGHKIFWLNITNVKKEFGYSKNLVNNRCLEIKRVIEKYKCDDFFDLGLPPSGLGQCNKKQLIEDVSNIITRVRPDTILLPYGHDVHTDHQIVFDTVVASSKNFRQPSVKKILMMEILSETNFILGDKGFLPNYYVNIDNYLVKKIQIMRIYKSEIKKHPFPRSADSLRSLAILRGVEAGCQYAEAFRVLKWVE